MRRAAFTLIELLVVIAIIAILAAILFPVFAQAKLAAKKTAGLAQMKQIGTAAQLYMGDFDDGLPTWSVFWADFYTPPVGAKPGSLDVPERYWDYILAPYVKNGNLIKRNPDNTIVRDYSGIWKSPGAEYPPAVGRSLVINQMLIWDASKRSDTCADDPNGSPNTGCYLWPAGSLIDEPATSIFIADGGIQGRYEPIQFGDGYAEKWLTKKNPTRSAPWRYGDQGANYVWADSHANYMPGDKVYPNPGHGKPFSQWGTPALRNLFCANLKYQAALIQNKDTLQRFLTRIGHTCPQ